MLVAHLALTNIVNDEEVSKSNLIQRGLKNKHYI